MTPGSRLSDPSSGATAGLSDGVGRAGGLRTDFSAEILRSLAREYTDYSNRGRLLAVASIYDGVAPDDVARIWGISASSLCQLLRRFEEDGLEGLFGCPTEGKSQARREEEG